MTEERQMVVEAVLAGQIGEEHLTQAELDEMLETVCDLAMSKIMEEAEARGCTVFYGCEEDTLH